MAGGRYFFGRGGEEGSHSSRRLRLLRPTVAKARLDCRQISFDGTKAVI